MTFQLRYAEIDALWQNDLITTKPPEWDVHGEPDRPHNLFTKSTTAEHLENALREQVIVSPCGRTLTETLIPISASRISGKELAS